MTAPTRDIFSTVYDATDRGVGAFIASVDRSLIEDGTYFVVDLDGEFVACGQHGDVDRPSGDRTRWLG